MSFPSVSSDLFQRIKSNNSDGNATHLSSLNKNANSSSSNSYHSAYSSLWLNDSTNPNTNSNILTNNTSTNNTNISNINTTSLSNLKALNCNYSNNSLFNLNKSSDINKNHQYEQLIEEMDDTASNPKNLPIATSANQKNNFQNQSNSSNSSSSETIAPSLNYSSILNSELNENKSFVNIEKLKFNSKFPKIQSIEIKSAASPQLNTISNPYVTKIMTSTSPNRQNQAYISTISTNSNKSNSSMITSGNNN